MQVIVNVNGRPVRAPDGGSFFVFDGCDECFSKYNDHNLDFSLPGLGQVAGNDTEACRIGVVPHVGFDITDRQIMAFVP